MQTTALLKKEAPKGAVPTIGKFTNPLQRKAVDEEDALQMKQNPLQLQTGLDEEEDEPLQMKEAPVQRMDGLDDEEEEPLQMKQNPLQRVEDNKNELLQKKENPLQLKKEGQNPLQLKQANGSPLQLQAEETATPQPKKNNTGLPDNLKAGVEALSGYSMDDVKVHYNSDKPAQLQALAYAQGTNIHVAQGQEEHLPHEAWHVVQQKQGRVQPTVQMKQGVAVNNEEGLEREADVMGIEAVQLKNNCLPKAIIQRQQQKIINSGSRKNQTTAENRKIEDFTQNVLQCKPVSFGQQFIDPFKLDLQQIIQILSTNADLTEIARNEMHLALQQKVAENALHSILQPKIEPVLEQILRGETIMIPHEVIGLVHQFQEEVTPPILSLMPFSQEEKESYLANHPNQAAAVKVLNWVHSIADADKIMTLNPTLDEVDQIMDLNKAIPDLLGLLALFSVNNVPQFLKLSNPVNVRNSFTNEWDEINSNWESLKISWIHWPIGELFKDTDQIWKNVSQAVRKGTKNEPDPNADQIQIFRSTMSRMRSRINAIRDFTKALDKGQAAFELSNSKLLQVDELLKEINKMLIYHNNISNPDKTIIEQQLEYAKNAKNIILSQRDKILNKKDKYNLLTDISSQIANSEFIEQNGHSAQLNFGISPSIPTISYNINGFRTNYFKDAISYSNLNLTATAQSGAFWNSLTLSQKTNLNNKLNGFAPKSWGEAGYPQTRHRQNGYTGPEILIPKLTGNFPLDVSGEIVHDWIFDSPGHGHPALEMKKIVNLAISGQPYTVGANFICQPQEQKAGSRTTYTWQNAQLNVVVQGNTLITYYNPQ